MCFDVFFAHCTRTVWSDSVCIGGWSTLGKAQKAPFLLSSFLFFSSLGGCYSGIENLLSKSFGDLFFFWGFVISPYQCQPKTHPFDLKLSDQTPLFLDTIEKAYFQRRCFCCCLHIGKWILKFLSNWYIFCLFWQIVVDISRVFVEWNRWRISCQNRYCFPTVRGMGSFWSK